MGCCGKVKQIAEGYGNLVRGKKYEFTNERILVCQKCQYNYWIHRSLWCSLCKCYVPAAARSKDKKCPKNLWPS